jgi:hypothetical protein
LSARLALVTGASSGIGAALARVYASHGFDLALTARRADRLHALADELRLRFGVDSLVIPADLSLAEAPEQVLATIEANGREVDALVNNAGYGLAGGYGASAWPVLDEQLQVMLTAPCELARMVLPGMVGRGFGRIVNVASLAGLIPGAAGSTLYSPIKSFLVKFSQGLHLETLRTGVHVCALCPGFTWSEFHDVNDTRARMSRVVPAWMWQSAEAVAKAGYAAAEANRPVCVPGLHNKAIAVLARVVPDAWLMAVMAREGHRFRPI